MKWLCTTLLWALMAFAASGGQPVYETTSAYHHIRVVDDAGYRLMCFDDAMESRILLQDPLKGHFEYTEFFHMPWLWNTQLASVLIVGLGGGTTQVAFEHYYPQVNIETVEIDPTVLQVARAYFNFKESERQKVSLSDGRMFLRRSKSKYDVIILDAYVQGRYGSSIPQHLATKEFFELARDHLNPTNGLIAYNVIGSLNGWHANIVGSIYRTLKTVYPQVYLFPARTSQNVVLVATTARVKAEMSALRWRAAHLVQSRQITLPGFAVRVEQMQSQPPANTYACPVLTDDFAPVEGLSGDGGASKRD